MTFIHGAQARLAVTLPVLAGLLAPIAAAQGLSCAGASSIKFTGALAPLTLGSDHVIGNKGLRGLIVWIHGVFGAILVPSEDPMTVLKTKRAELQSGEYGAVVWSLVRQNVLVFLLILMSLSMCVVLPVVATAAIACHRVCWCCNFWQRPGGYESVLETKSRKRWTYVFYVVVVIMS
ncbi:uncharacterized protein LOC142591011 [Dermacentor variabilis]|uniref:uncharacterized protein LOC142591011 n=1 Tax=Dermacentor variabilis TaxID=34621 RepID=UPI003F5BBC31